MSIRILLAICLLILIEFSITSNTIHDINWILNVSYNQKFKPNNEDITDGYYYLLSENQINLDTQSEYNRYAVKVENETGLASASTIDLTYDSTYQTLLFEHIHIIRNNKIIDILKNHNIESFRRETRMENGITDGRITSLVEVKDLRVGDILEYAYSIEGFNPVKKDFLNKSYFTNYSVPVGQITIAIASSDKNKYHYQLYNNAPEPDIITKDRLYYYKWDIKNPTIINVEDDTPSWHSPYGRITFSSKKTWENVANHMCSLYDLKTPLNRDIITFIDSIKQKYSSEEHQVLAIIRYVQNSIRYLGTENGIYGYQPRHPNIVFQNKAGDCKEKSLLLTSMLKKIGIEAWPVLVNTYNGFLLEDQLPGIELFDHCIACIQNDDQLIYIDPTISNQGGDLNSIQTPNYNYGLRLKQNTKALEQLVVNLNNKTEIYETFNIADYSGEATLEVKSIYRDSQADDQRNYLKNNSLKDIQLSFLKFYANLYPYIDTLSCVEYEDDIINNTLTVHETYKISNIWESDSITKQKTFYLQASSLNSMVSRSIYPKRKSPMALKNKINFKQTITIVLPEPWNIKNEQVNLSGPGFKYHKTIINSNDTAKYIFQYETNKSYIPTNEYMDFITKNETIQNDLDYSIYYNDLTKTDEEGQINISLLFIAILVLLISSYIAIRIYKFDPTQAFNNSTNKGIPIESWLVLLGIGITLNPLVNIFNFFRANYLFDPDILACITPNTINYSVGFTILILLEFTYNISFIVFSILNLILFYKKRSIFPKFFIYLFSSKILFLILDNYFASQLNGGINNEINIIKILSPIVYAGIWITYLSISQRVKNTFTKTYSSNP